MLLCDNNIIFSHPDYNLMKMIWKIYIKGNIIKRKMYIFHGAVVKRF